MTPQRASEATKVLRKANRRGAARLAAVQALYQMDVAGADLASTLADFEKDRLGEEVEGQEMVAVDMGFFRDLVSGVVRTQLRVDPLIHGILVEGWPLKRLDLTLRAILRSGAYELLDRADVPPRVVISEYVDVARAFFSGGEEPGMVNAILDRLARRTRAEGFAEGEQG